MVCRVWGLWFMRFGACDLSGVCRDFVGTPEFCNDFG